MNSVNRRVFIKSASITAGVMAASTLTVGRSAYAEGTEKKLRAVLIGCGGRGRGAVKNYLDNPNTEIVAVADMFEDRARTTAKLYNLPEDRIFWGFSAYRKVIAVDCDIVILATPPGFRPIHYKAAVEAGKHVFMEKPCCVDAPGFRMLLETNKIADEKGLKVGVGLQRRHQKNYINGIKEIQDGKYGDILYTRVYWNGDGVWVSGRKPGMTEMQYQLRNWYYFNWLCGDNICEQHVHNLDVGLWVMGCTTPGEYIHPLRCNAMGGREVRKGNPDFGEIFDHHFVEYEFSDGRRMYSQCRHIRGTWSQVNEQVHGVKGHGGVTTRDRGVDAYKQEHTDLIAAIKNDTKYNEGWFGAYSSMTAVMGRMASYSGQVISWDDAVAKGPALMIYENHDQLTMDSEPPVKKLDNPVQPGAEYYAIAVPGIWKPW